MIRAAAPGDRDAALELLARAFGPADEAHRAERWDWLFVDNPFADRLHYVVAEADERLVGQYALVPVRLWHAGREVRGLLSLDTATDPDYQRQGVSTALARSAYEAGDRVSIVYGFPNRRSAPLLYRKLGWIELRPFPLLVRPLGGIRRTASARQRAIPGAVLDALARTLFLAERARPTPGARPPAAVEPFGAFSEWADRLWERVKGAVGTCAIRDAAFLNWRFRDAPMSYRKYLVRHGTEPAGFAVTACARWREFPISYLMEILVDPAHRGAARQLIATVARDERERGARALVAVATRRHPQRHILVRSGFLPVPARYAGDFSFGVLLNGPDAVAEALLAVDEWYISGADFDWI